MEKFLSFPTKKTWKISGLSGKTCLKTDDRNKIKQILLLKKFQESKKIMETDRKFSQLHIKKAGKIIPTKRKNLRKRMIRMEKAADFFADGRKNTEMHGKRSWKIYRIIRKKHEKYTADRNKFYHWRTVGLKKTDFSTGKVKRKKQKNPQSA